MGQKVIIGNQDRFHIRYHLCWTSLPQRKPIENKRTLKWFAIENEKCERLRFNIGLKK